MKKEQTIIHRAETRGRADHGWLKTCHTFSFAQYYDPDRMGFGALRVLNDDAIEGGSGFGTHPHENMEIVTIPLSGSLAHKDSMGSSSVIHAGEVQVMSAGTGVMHSEYNGSETETGQFLQIWIEPNEYQVAPRYAEAAIDCSQGLNRFQTIVSGNRTQSLWIHQEVFLSLGSFDRSELVNYELKRLGNGLYVFVIAGTATVQGAALGLRDGMGIWDTSKVVIEPGVESEILLIEVPMT